MNNQNDILVSVCCITYNHASYIRQCLDGFLMQKTNFKYEVIIHDDCSTDGTTEIVREYAEKYPDIIVPLFEEKNQYQNGVKRIMATFVYPKVRGKYMALCEGDDYWTDPLKLQKQFDYMESHPQCSLLHTAFKFLTEEDHTLHDSLIDQEEYNKCKEENLNVACEIFNFKYRVVTASSFMRYDCYTKVVSDEDFYKHSFYLGDIQLWAMLLQYGDIGYLPDYTTVYRVHADSACRQTNMEIDAKNHLEITEMQLFFLPKIKGADYLRSKIVNEFKINLFKYRLFNPRYRSFVNDKDCNLTFPYKFVLFFPFLRAAIVKLWKMKRVIMRNSATKISSMG